MYFIFIAMDNGIVTASDTAVFTSDTSSTVGFRDVINEATVTRANDSLDDRLSKITCISFVFSI